MGQFPFCNHRHSQVLFNARFNTGTPISWKIKNTDRKIQNTLKITQKSHSMNKINQVFLLFFIFQLIGVPVA